MEQTKFAFPMSDREMLVKMSELQKKIDKLQLLTNCKINKPQIFLFADYMNGDKEMFIQLDQSHIPFNLSAELKIIIEDSIEEYQRDIETLKYLLTIK